MLLLFALAGFSIVVLVISGLAGSGDDFSMPTILN
jgi:hypothetical protein